MNIEKRIQQLLNKPVKYGLKIITITSYSYSEDKSKVYIDTNERDRHFERPVDTLPALLKELEPTTEVAKTRSNNSDIAMSNTMSIAENLRNVLLDNIDKVRADPAYIPQATAINNNVNSIINLSKLQMDAVKLQKRFGDEQP